MSANSDVGQRWRSIASALWHRLDGPGHDVCRLSRGVAGWRLEGGAVFADERGDCRLAYRVSCDADWRTVSAVVAGWMGGDDLRLTIRRDDAGRWYEGQTVHSSLDGCIDLDLGFTPATNLLALRRLAFPLGETVAAPAAYFAFPERTLARLEQSYRRLDGHRFAYAAPALGYEAVLQAGDHGFLVDYPGLFRGVVRNVVPVSSV